MFDEGRKIGNILSYTTLSSRSLALAVAAPIVGKNTKRSREQGDDNIPDVMITPGTMDKDERVSVFSSLFPVKPDPIDYCAWHAYSFSIPGQRRSGSAAWQGGDPPSASASFIRSAVRSRDITSG
jgi:hypothetical protein